MEDCIYRYLDVRKHKNSRKVTRRCLIDFQKCSLFKNPELCATYYHYDISVERYEARDKSAFNNRGFRSSSDIVININL